LEIVRVPVQYQSTPIMPVSNAISAMNGRISDSRSLE